MGPSWVPSLRTDNETNPASSWKEYLALWKRNVNTVNKYMASLKGMQCRTVINNYILSSSRIVMVAVFD